MELMAEAQGLGVFYCGYFVYASQSNERMKKLLWLSDTQEIRVCLVLGKPDVTYMRTVPKETSCYQLEVNP